MSQVRMTPEQALAEARRWFAAADYHRAEHIVRQLLALRPRSAELLYELGRCQLQTARFVEARRSFEAARREAPSVPEVVVQLARCSELERKLPEALRLCDEALAIRADHPGALARKAGILDESGEKQGAYDLLRPWFDPNRPDVDIAFTFARICRRMKKTDEARAALEAILEHGQLPPLPRSQVEYRLGALLDEMKEFDRAFEMYARANAARAGRYDPMTTTRLVDRITEVWTRDSMAKLPVSPTTHNGMVFIIGMPRAGKTLVEQILASHPRVYGSGELSYMHSVIRELNAGAPPAAGEIRDASTVLDLSLIKSGPLGKVTRDYIAHTAGKAGKAAIVTDKYALNYFHLGLISRMFPKARIIHCSRHPFDTCLSCYFQSWTGSFHFCHDLRHLALFYKDYQRIMEHWKRELDLPILDVRYEDVVEDQEGWSRRMIEFLGLPWDERCMRFYETERSAQLVNQEQVRRPMYRSSLARYRNYAAHLAPLQDVLGFKE